MNQKWDLNWDKTKYKVYKSNSNVDKKPDQTMKINLEHNLKYTKYQYYVDQRMRQSFLIHSIHACHIGHDIKSKQNYKQHKCNNN